MNHRPKCKGKTLKLLEENTVKQNLCDFGVGKDSLEHKKQKPQKKIIGNRLPQNLKFPLPEIFHQENEKARCSMTGRKYLRRTSEKEHTQNT